MVKLGAGKHILIYLTRQDNRPCSQDFEILHWQRPWPNNVLFLLTLVISIWGTKRMSTVPSDLLISLQGSWKALPSTIIYKQKLTVEMIVMVEVIRSDARRR